MTGSDSTVRILTFLPFLIFFSVFVLVAVLAYLGYQARRQAWGELAARMGLMFEPGGLLTPMRITGAYRGHPLTLDTFKRSSGKSSTTYTRIRLGVNNPSALTLAIYDENVLNRIGKALGMQDIQVGDDELDRRFRFKGQPEPLIISLFASLSLRTRLLEARSLHVEIQGQELRFEERGAESNTDRLQFLFDLLSDLVEAVDRVGGSVAPGWSP